MVSSFVNYVCDLLSGYGSIRARAMFGGYGIYCNDIIFAIIIEDEVYFKTDKELAAKFASIGSSPFTYEAKSKTIALSYWKLPIEIMEDETALQKWFDQAMVVARAKK